MGIAASEMTSLLPQLVEDLSAVRIVDVAVGDSHILALTNDSEVFSWGNNSMGQCGQGHSSSPITRPRRVLGLEGVPVNQMSAGTSHSIFWTASPSDRFVIAPSFSVTCEAWLNVDFGKCNCVMRFNH